LSAHSPNILRVPLSALLLLVLAGIAFWPPYFSRPQEANAYVHVHVVLGVMWLLLLIVQPLLIRAAMRRQHRLLGRIGLALGGAFAVSGALMAQKTLASMGAEQFAEEGRFVYLPLAMVAIFTSALAMAVFFRASPAVHARFMAATILPLLDPVLARMLFYYAPPLPVTYLYQVPAFVLTLTVLTFLTVTAPAATSGRTAFAWFSIATAVTLLGFFVIPSTVAWLTFTDWFRALPIT
jgi:hypothetical protein